jgi:hypothetical protein
MAARKQTEEVIPPWGPKMAAVNERQRNFIIAMHSDDAPEKGDGLYIWAAEQAGYGRADGTSTNKTLSVIASRLIQDEAIKAAMAEYARSEWRALLPRAVRAVKNVIRDKSHRDHGRVAMAAIDRIDPVETAHTLKIEDNRPPAPAMTQKVLDRIEELMRLAGLPKPAPMIEGQCVVIEERGT